MSTIRHCRNSDGSWSGAATMAAITNLTEEEVRWTWDRLSLMLQGGMDRYDAMALIKEQAKEQPWKQPPTAT